MKFSFFVFISLLLIGTVLADTQIYSSQYATWYVSNSMIYTQNSLMINQTIVVLDAAIPQMQNDFGFGFSLPVQVHIVNGGCCGGYTSAGNIGLNVGDFSTSIVCSGTQFSWLNWTEGVVVGEFANTETGAVTSGWPRDWWADDKWYFPAMVVVQVLQQAGYSQLAGIWQQNAGGGCTSYTSIAGYDMFEYIATTYGWAPYKNAFSAIRADGMILDSLGPNPSELRSEYVAAYLSLANSTIESYLVSQLNSFGLTYNVSQNNVTAIINARNEIYAAKSNGGDIAAALQSFDSGDYNLAMAQAEAANTTTSTSESTTVLTTTSIPTTTVRTTTTTLTTTLTTTSTSTTSINTTSTTSTSSTSTSLTTTVNSYKGTVSVSESQKTVLPTVAATTFTLYSTSQMNQSIQVSLVNEAAGKLPAGPSRTVLISAYNISVPAGTQVTVNAVSSYPCDLNASQIAPYKLIDGNWVPIIPFAINVSACSVSYSVPPDPLVAIFETVPLPTTVSTSTVSATTTTPQQNNQAGQQTALIEEGGAMVVLLLIAIYVVLRFRPKEPKSTSPAPSMPEQGTPQQPNETQPSTY